MITVIGIFADLKLAEQAANYLLANEFDNENIDLHTDSESESGIDRIADYFGHLYNEADRAGHYASLARSGTVITVHAISTRQAQEAADVFNNHGAIRVDADGGRSLVIEQIVEPAKRLRSGD